MPPLGCVFKHPLYCYPGKIDHIWASASPKDVDQAVAMLCRALEVSSWKPVRAAKFLMDHPKKNEVLEVPRKRDLGSRSGGPVVFPHS